ncbi:MAG TPA: divalent-cation tolerance protein CutA [Alphaproteobacteria bacterium]|nr:divalent-cation tolerance protein CutA [Alphaproteobacteria bacterium]
MSIALVYITTSGEDEAKAIAHTLVRERLAACANILGAIRSVYWWEGEVEEGEEVSLVLKTKAELVERLTARVKALHSYAVPCVVALPIRGGNRDFLEYVEKETVSGSA